MARILLFDNMATVDSRDNRPLDSNFRLMQQAAGAVVSRSYPVRCYGLDEDIRYIGWEMMVDAPDTNGAEMTLTWWQEYFNDGPSVVRVPDQRTWPGVDLNAGWAREVASGLDAAIDAAGVRLQTVHVPRETTFSFGRLGEFCEYTDESFLGDTLYFPLAVHSMWTRLAFYVSATSNWPGLGGEAWVDEAAMRFRIWANIGGHTEIDYLRENPTVPYAYNAYVSQ
jgi:hypothetical protein